jgi:hypothetical protein
MAQNANTVETYDVTTIREDISDLLKSLSPVETPVFSMCKQRKASNTYVEFAEVDLAAAVSNNQVAEGEASPGNDAGTLPVRKGTYTEIADKVVEVSSTDEAVNGVANAQTLAQQIAFKTKELKRDLESSICANKASNAGAGNGATARVTAGLPAWLTSNVSRGTGGSNPTLSGGTPNAGATDSSGGNQRAFTEAMLSTVIASCWDNGAEPRAIVCGSFNKQKISGFSGNASKQYDYSNSSAGSRAIVAGFSIYESDFGTLTVQPSRFSRGRDCFVVDPDHLHIATLQPLTQKPLAKTGHAERRLISTEMAFYAYEKAHGVIADLTTA